jgi:UDP-N-acetyl-D-mannosaminuronic acid dehydrogenase
MGMAVPQNGSLNGWLRIKSSRRNHQIMKDHICVIGLGYIGLPTAIMFVKQGFQLTGVDVNPAVISRLKSGELHIHEDGLADAFNGALATGRLAFSESPVVADVFIIAVPTPFNSDKSADLSYVTSAAISIRGVLKTGDLVILESTSPPRTTIDRVLPILEESGLACGKDFDLVYSPERVLPGKILEELIHNDRIVGGITEDAAQRAKALYSSFVRGQIHITDPTTAEMVKLMENTYRDVNIALANEFSRIAVEQEIDIWEAVKLANHHPRVNVLRPGPGVGGHCISVDPWFLVEASPGVSELIRTARQVNDAQPAYFLDFVQERVGNLFGKTIAVLGLSYKPNIDDLRESPAITLVRLLDKAGAQVRTYEPYVPGYWIGEGITPCYSLEEALRGAEGVFLLVAHEEFGDLTGTCLFEKSGLVSPEDFFLADAVNILKRETSHGLALVRLGDGRAR